MVHYSRGLRVALGVALLGGCSECTPHSPSPSTSSREPTTGTEVTASGTAQASATAAAALTPAVTMEAFDDDFGPLFPRAAFLRARGVEEVVAVSRTLADGGAVGAARQTSRRYDAAGELVEERETDDGKLLRVRRHERDDNGLGREILDDAVWSTTTTTTVTRDAKGRTSTRTNEREHERYSYEGENLVLVEREEAGRRCAKRFRYEGGRVVAVLVEQDGVLIRAESREYDARGREVRRVTKKQEVLLGKVVPLTPVEVRVHYTANDEIDSLDVAEGKPLLRRTFRYEGGSLVEEQRRSFIAAVSDERTTFSYRLHAK